MLNVIFNILRHFVLVVSYSSGHFAYEVVVSQLKIVLFKLASVS